MKYVLCMMGLAALALAGCASESETFEPVEAREATPMPEPEPPAVEASPEAIASLRLVQPEKEVKFIGETVWIMIEANDPAAFSAVTYGGSPLEGQLYRMLTNIEIRDGGPADGRDPLYVLSSVMTAEPGVRELVVGDEVLQVGAGAGELGEETESGLPAYRIHPSTAVIDGTVLECDACHTLLPGDPPMMSVNVDMVESCMSFCHDEDEFFYAHEHLVFTLRQCSMCHDLHASTDPMMLKEPPSVVCGYCHVSHRMD